ncbi:endo-beta-1,3-glucanase [Clavulina sp. PMI_390]|nr:endo-beta-1,3-glucanase [Clavulina sp. PMI_390]
MLARLSFALTLTALASSVHASGKRGLAWPWWNAPLNPAAFSATNQTVAIYDWETYAPPTSTGKTGGLQFIGMQASKDSSSSPVSQLATRQAQQGWKTAFSLNEPDINGISPSDAAAWYKQYINPLKIKKALPAITNSGATNQGLDWLRQMVAACHSGGDICWTDYVNLHWYGTTIADFKAHVQQARSMFPQYQIVITEFALNNNPGSAVTLEFYKEAFAFLDGLSYVKLYFPFIATSPYLLDKYAPSTAANLGTALCLYNNDGTLSPVGKLML